MKKFLFVASFVLSSTVSADEEEYIDFPVNPTETEISSRDHVEAESYQDEVYVGEVYEDEVYEDEVFEDHVYGEKYGGPGSKGILYILKFPWRL